LALLWTASMPATAGDLAGTKQVWLHARDGARVPIGQVDFEPAEGGATAFRLRLDGARFNDHFLSMREFKCLPAPDEILCHVPYPYPHPGTVRAGDLAWLEHQLLFMFKRPRDFGANLWNGVYYRLAPRGQGLVGTPEAVDLNLISAPPDDLQRAPLRPALRDPMPEGARWYERLTIE
jgi:hypothetical protein